MQKNLFRCARERLDRRLPVRLPGRRSRRSGRGDDTLKVLFIASSGGHLKQLQRLSAAAKGAQSVWVTEDVPHLQKDSGWYVLPQIHRREAAFPIRFLHVGALSVRIICREQPDVVVSTGALASVPMLLLAKLTGRTVIFIESFAKVSSPTLTGRLAYRIADKFYIQWESLRSHYPKATFAGSVYL